VWKYGRHPICEGLRLGEEEKEERKKKKETTGQNIMACPIP